MQTLLFIIFGLTSVLIWTAAADRLLPQKMSHYSIFIAIATKATLIYQLVFVFGYVSVQTIIYTISLVLFFYLKLYQKIKIKSFASDHKIFLVLATAWIILTYKFNITLNDEFFWASFVKHLYLFDHFWTSKDLLVVGYYLPGFPVWERFFVGTEFVNEQPLIYALGLIFFASFCALYKKFKDRHNLYIMFFIFSAITYAFATFGIESIYVDTLVGIIFGTSLMAIYDFEDTKDILVPVLCIIFLGFVKDTAFLLSLLSLFILGLKIIRQKNFLSYKTVFLFAGLLVITLNYLLWHFHLKSADLISPMAGHATKMMIQDFVQISPRTSENFKIFLNALWNQKFPVSRKFDFVHSNMIINFLFLASAFIYIRKSYEFIVGYVFGFIGYTFSILVFWFYVTSEYEGDILASYERYFGTFLFAFGILFLKVIADQNLLNKKFIKYSLIVLSILFLPSFRMYRIPSSEKIRLLFNTENYKSDGELRRLTVRPINDLINTNTPENAKIWFVWQKSMGYELMVARYEIMPRKIPVQNFSIGEKHYDGDVWTHLITEDHFTENLAKIDFLAIGFINENFIKNYKHFFITPIKNNALYKTVLTDSGLKLSEITYKEN